MAESKKPAVTTPIVEIFSRLLQLPEWQQYNNRPFSTQICTFRRTDFNSLINLRVTFSEDEQIVIKFPRYKESETACSSIQQEYENLDLLSGNDGVTSNLPVPAHLHVINEVPVLVTPFVPGTGLHQIIGRNTTQEGFREDFGKCVDFLVRLHSVPVAKEEAPVIVIGSESFLEQYLFQPFHALSSAFPDETASIGAYIETIAELARQHAGTEIRSCFEHRDFNPYNINLRPSGKLLVLDWEDGTAQGLPLMDYFNLAVIWFRLVADAVREQPPEARREALAGFIGLASGSLDSYCSSTGFPCKLADLFFVIFLLRNTGLFLAPKRNELQYSRNWWYFLNLGLTGNIFADSLGYEASRQSS